MIERESWPCGELGYNLINEMEEEIFVKQMNIAAQKDMLITVHLPHNNKPDGMEKIEGILNGDKSVSRHNRKKYW